MAVEVGVVVDAGCEASAAVSEPSARLLAAPLPPGLTLALALALGLGADLRKASATASLIAATTVVCSSDSPWSSRLAALAAAGTPPFVLVDRDRPHSELS